MVENTNWLGRINVMANGYRQAVVLLSAVKSGIFDALGEDSLTSAEVARRLDLDHRATDVVLCALVAAEILIQDDERFSIDVGARPYLLKDSPDTLTSILGHNLTIMKQWVHLSEVLRTGLPAERASGPERTEEELRDFICGMENVSRRSSLDVVAKIDLAGARRLLDLGGGPGTSSITFAAAHRELHCVVFDLTGPIEIAREQIDKVGLSDRVTTRIGDFHVDKFGSDFDVVYISNIIHQMGEDETLQLFESSRAALVTGGRILVKDFFLDDTRTRPATAAMFSVNMLAVTRRGKSYTRNETLDLLRRAGFDRFEVVDVATESQVIVGYAT